MNEETHMTELIINCECLMTYICLKMRINLVVKCYVEHVEPLQNLLTEFKYNQ